MTVSSETSKSGPYNGNGATTVFAYGFRVLQESHVRVVKRGTDDVETDLTLTTDYTVSGVGDSNGGNVTIPSAPAVGETITIVRDIPLTQGTDFENQGAYFAQTHEDAFDKLSMQVQQVNEEVDRAVKVQVSDDTTDPDALIDSIAASESAAATSAGAAATSATAASTSAGEAAQSAIDAAQSAANAGTNVVAAIASPEGLSEGKEWWDSENGKLYVEHEGRLIQANHTANVPGDADSLQIATNTADIAAQNIKLNTILRNGADAILEDQKTSGVNGGTATTGSYETRDLNTKVYDPQSLITLISNEFTSTVSGEVSWSCPASVVNNHKSRLWNVTDGVAVKEGANAYSGVGEGVQTTSDGNARIVAGKTYRLEHRVAVTKADTGYGFPASFGDTEVYSRLEFRRDY